MSSTAPILLIANFADRLGGGEESLLTLIQGMDRRRFVPHVVVPGEGEIARALRKIGVVPTFACSLMQRCLSKPTEDDLELNSTALLNAECLIVLASKPS